MDALSRLGSMVTTGKNSSITRKINEPKRATPYHSLDFIDLASSCSRF